MIARHNAPRRDTLRRLARTLETEQNRLRAGGFADLAPLTRRIDQLCTTLESQPGAPDPAESALLQSLRAGAEHNLRLTRAAIEGLRDAQRLIATARAPQGGSVYDRDGARTAMAAQAHQLERRR